MTEIQKISEKIILEKHLAGDIPASHVENVISKIVDAYFAIGNTIYHVYKNTYNPPKVSHNKVHHILVFEDKIGLYDEYNGWLCNIEDVGHWREDMFSSFSEEEAKMELEKILKNK